MPSSKAYLTFVLDQLTDLDGITYRPMMREYLIYYQGRLIGGIYDDRLLVKVTPAARMLMPEAQLEPPYEGGREMLLVESIDNSVFLCQLFNAMLPELPLPRKK